MRQKMLVNFNCNSNVLQVLFTPETGDGVAGKARLIRNQCRINVPNGWKIDSTHPDVLALCAILLVYPFTKERIQLPFGVSKAFAENFEAITKKKISPVNAQLSTRKPLHNSKPALAYSGGVDSTAALALMPSNTILFFLDRVSFQNPNSKSLYNSEAAHYACNHIRKTGRKVYKVKTDLEYIRKPVGFPTDFSNSIPALLMADRLGLDSIAFGTVLESAYRVGHNKYMNYPDRSHYKLWGSLFALVGMPLYLPVSGISEVATTIIVNKSPYKNIAQSCIRGQASKPCLKCVKCFRKTLVEKTLNQHMISDDLLNRFFSINEIKRYILNTPIKHENVIAFITNNYKNNHRIMNLLKRKSRGDLVNVSWLNKWYSPSLCLIPDKYKTLTQENILKYINEMNKMEIAELENWNTNSFSNTPIYKETYKKLKSALQ
jgi:hypothetical protein